MAPPSQKSKSPELSNNKGHEHSHYDFLSPLEGDLLHSLWCLQQCRAGKGTHCRISVVEPSQSCNLKENGGLDLSGDICSESSSDPLEKYCAHAWTSIPEKYLEQDDLVIVELQENSEVTKATPTCGRDRQCPVPLQEDDQPGQGHRHANQYAFWVFPTRSSYDYVQYWWRVSFWAFGISCSVPNAYTKERGFPTSLGLFTSFSLNFPFWDKVSCTPE